jgi:tocopherol cyclase
MQATFSSLVEEGFQATESHHQGCIINRPDTCLGELPTDVPCVHWNFTVEPVYGYGDAGKPQRSTAGWLAALPVLEPHWQVLMAHGLATGYVQWGEDKRMELSNTPFYAEKNWGGTFPRRWAWVQCNTFAGCPDLAVTGALALRDVLGSQEEVGILSVHHNGRLIEVSSADGDFSWDVQPWGSWVMRGKSDKYVLAEATCAADAGTPLRAPTGPTGLIPACRDTFEGAAPVGSALRLRICVQHSDTRSARACYQVEGNLLANALADAQVICGCECGS